MKVELSIPVPRGYDYTQAMDWAADVFAEFIDRGWKIREYFTVEVGRGGKLTFIAERAAEPLAKLPPDVDVTIVPDERARGFADGEPGNVVKLDRDLSDEEMSEVKRRFVDALAKPPTSVPSVDVTPSAEGLALLRYFEGLSNETRDRILHGPMALYHARNGWYVS